MERFKLNGTEIEILDIDTMYVFTVLIMLDQLHDFGESDRPSNVHKYPKISYTNRLKTLNPVYLETKRFLEKTTPNENINPKLQKLHGLTFDPPDCRHLLSGDKYILSDKLLKAIKITNTSFDKIAASGRSFPSHTCREIQNVFHDHITGLSDSNSLKIVLDMNRSKYDISPLLYNVSEYALSSTEMQFENIELIEGLAKSYDASPIQTFEKFINDIGTKKRTRIKLLKEKNETDEIRSYVSLLERRTIGVVKKNEVSRVYSMKYKNKTIYKYTLEKPNKTGGGVVPTIEKWFDYEDFSKSKVNMRHNVFSQPYITKIMRTTPGVEFRDYKNYFVYKTIGDLSQIHECTDFPFCLFITADRICGHISSLFNHTILEHTVSQSLFNLSTFVYEKTTRKRKLGEISRLSP